MASGPCPFPRSRRSPSVKKSRRSPLPRRRKRSDSSPVRRPKRSRSRSCRRSRSRRSREKKRRFSVAKGFFRIRWNLFSFLNFVWVVFVVGLIFYFCVCPKIPKPWGVHHLFLQIVVPSCLRFRFYMFCLCCVELIWSCSLQLACGNVVFMIRILSHVLFWKSIDWNLFRLISKQTY